MKKSRGTSGPLVSIVTVTLNAGAALERTIESVRWQSYPLIQYVVVDGGSTDGTLDMIKKFKNTIDRVLSEEDFGIYHAMNKGLALCKGDLVYFLNAGDCLYDTTVISDVVDEYCRYDWDLIYGDAVLVSAPCGENVHKRHIDVSMDKLKNGYMICHQAVYVRKSVMKEFDTRFRLSADFDLLCRLFKEGLRKKYLPRNVCYYATGGASSDRNVIIKEKTEIIRENFGRLYGWRYCIFQYIRSRVRAIAISLDLLRYYHKLRRMPL